MNFRKLSLCITLALVSLSVSAQRASAFDYLGAAWCCDTIKFCIRNRISADATPNNQTCLAGGSWSQGVATAAATWNNLGLAFELRDGHGTILAGCAPDGMDSCRFAPTMDNQNTVSLAKDCDFPAGFLAVANVWTNTQTCCIIEADICFSDFRNSNEGWYSGINACPGGPGGSCFDVETVALHEFGHWAGLGHEDDFVGGSKQVMHSATGPCDIRRTLTSDDLAGIQFVHGANSVIQPSQRCLTIHSHPTYATSSKVPQSGACGPSGCLGTCNSEFDFDGDGICDSVDNCPDDWNLFQEDADSDTWGDVCDCNPNVTAINPGQTELCANGIDDDCNGLTDGADPACGQTACCNLAGDANGSGSINISDATYLIAYIFSGGLKPPCCEEGDANGSGSINISDATYIIAYIFSGGGAPICGPAGMSC